MRSLIFVVIILSLNCQFILAETYCEMQTRHCGTYRHIGCDTNEFEYNKHWKHFELGHMQSNLKALILDKYNSLKNDVALGSFGHPTASNLQLVIWSPEFQKLSQLEVKHVAYGEDTCNLINKFYAVYPMHLKVKNQNLTSHQLVDKLFGILKAETLKSDEAWVSEYVAGVLEIGCAFSTYVENNDSIEYINCGINAGHTSYKHGAPCTECEHDRTCNSIYEGLCN